MALHLVTAGESHGPALVAIVTGLPAGLRLDKEAIDGDLRRRQQGYGRSPRQKLESDEVEVLAGLRHGETLGTPLALVVRNRDHANWTWGMSPWPPAGDRLRPGRARSPSRCPGRGTPTSPESSSTTTTTSATRSSVPRRATPPSTSPPARSRRHSSASSGSQVAGQPGRGRRRDHARRGCGTRPTRRAPIATPSAGSSRWSPTASRPGWARTRRRPTGSTRGSRSR